MLDLWPEQLDEVLEDPEAAPPAFHRQCRRCGCSESEPCEGGCFWVEGEVPPLCSRCVVLEVLRT